MPQFKRRGREFVREGIESNLDGFAASLSRPEMSQGVRGPRANLPRLSWPVIAEVRSDVTQFHWTEQNFAVVGVTRDNVGAALGGMTVHLFRLGQAMELIASGMSDGGGNYALPTPNNAGPFFVVSFHPDGSLAGVTRAVLVATAV